MYRRITPCSELPPHLEVDRDVFDFIVGQDSLTCEVFALGDSLVDLGQ